MVLAALLVPLLAGGCAKTDHTCRGPVTGAISYYGSSVPPPYHVEWTITLKGDRGHFEVTPGYGAAQHWSADFVADQHSVSAACLAVAEADQVDDPPPGSAVITAELTDGDGHSVRRRTTAAPSGEVYSALRAVVPTATWDHVYGAYDGWSRDQ